MRLTRARLQTWTFLLAALATLLALWPRIRAAVPPDAGAASGAWALFALIVLVFLLASAPGTPNVRRMVRAFLPPWR